MRILLFGLMLCLSTSIHAQLLTGKITTGAEINTWKPLQLDAVSIITKGYEVGYVELGLKFSNFAIPKLRYESNFETEKQNDIIALQENKQSISKYESFLGEFEYKKLVARFSHETYISAIIALNNFNFVSREGVVSPVGTGQYAGFTTQFQTIFLGTDIRKFKTGLFYSTYTKPYFLTDDAFQDRNTMYHAEFKAYGAEAYRVVDLGAAGSFSDLLPSTDKVGFHEVFLALQWTKSISKKSAFKIGSEARTRTFYKISSNDNSSGGDRGFNSDITTKFIMSYEYKFLR